MYGTGNTGCFSFATLIILILIVLQFSKKRGYSGGEDGEYKDGSIIDNSILFIIAFFFLVCGCGCGRSQIGSMGYGY